MKQKIYCPTCGKWLCTIEKGIKGTVYLWCRQCKKEIKLVLFENSVTLNNAKY